MPPKIILNAPTKLMKEEGYGSGYGYDHDTGSLFRPGLFAGRNSDGNSSTIRSSAASSAKSANGWTIGRSCGESGGAT